MAAATVDFRTLAWDRAKLNSSGKDIGRKTYWRLFAIENLVRVLVNSVLFVQIGPNWWAVGVDPDIKGRVLRFKADYALQPWHSTPGGHDVYYTQLPDLARIIRDNSHLFLPIVSDIDAWVARLDQIRLPRNIVGHMNWPSAADRRRIEAFHADFEALTRHVEASGIAMIIP